MTTALRRRDFLKLGAFAGALAPGFARAAIGPRGQNTIVVVGAGLAGLACAHRLRETGRNVVVLEARNMAGGRVRTIRAPFDDGVYGEAGAARISDVHHFVLHWLNTFNLSVVPFSPPEGRTLFVMNGRRAFSDDPMAGEQLVPDLRADERGLRPYELVNRYLEGLPADLGLADLDPGSFVRWSELDRTTWPEWLRTRGASEGAVRLLTLGADSTEVSALYVLRQIFLHRAGRGYLKIEGGMDRLPRAMADDLGDIIQTDCEVVGIEHGPQGVRVSYRESDEIKVVAGERAILAIPYSVLRGIAVDPPFSAGKAEVIADLPYRSSMRFLLQTGTRYWRADGRSGAARTDGPCEIWDASSGQISVRGLLSVTAGGQAAMRRRFGTLSETQQLRLGLDLATAAFPNIAMHYQRGFTQNWTDDPWSRGAFAIWRPGQMTRWGANMQNPEGRIHFAGEHASPWPGWMEGALWSAERVVQEIL